MHKLSSNKIKAQKINKKHEKLILEATQSMSKLESVQKPVIINHISINKKNTKPFNLFNPEPRYFGVGDGCLRRWLDVNRVSL